MGEGGSCSEVYLEENPSFKTRFGANVVETSSPFQDARNISLEETEDGFVHVRPSGSSS